MVNMGKNAKLKVKENVAKTSMRTSYSISFLSRQNNDPKDIFFVAMLLSRTTQRIQVIVSPSIIPNILKISVLSLPHSKTKLGPVSVSHPLSTFPFFFYSIVSHFN